MIEYYETARNSLSNIQKEWAYSKWYEGYTQQQIAEALNVSHKTISRAIGGRPRIRPILIYRKENAV
jgi:DNA-directed RNA polymerase specialized sigma24 family protein